MLALTLVLQLFSVPVYGRGGFGVSAIGILAAAFLLNTGTAMAAAVVAALLQWARRRSELDKAIFDAGNLVIAAGAAGLTFHALDGASRLLAAAVAGCVYAALNNGLVCLAMSLAEKADWRAVWHERFHWARFYFLLFGPLALVAETAFNLMGVQGLVSFTVPPGVIMRTHPLVSDFILAELDLDPIVRECARSSHERMDGHGYPDGLSGENVPLPARIVFVADALDAITTDRPYRRGRSTVDALVEIEANAGTQFCPRVVGALRAIWQARPDILAADEPPAALPPRVLRLLELA